MNKGSNEILTVNNETSKKKFRLKLWYRNIFKKTRKRICLDIFFIFKKKKLCSYTKFFFFSLKRKVDILSDYSSISNHNHDAIINSKIIFYGYKIKWMDHIRVWCSFLGGVVNLLCSTLEFKQTMDPGPALA